MISQSWNHLPHEDGEAILSDLRGPSQIVGTKEDLC